MSDPWSQPHPSEQSYGQGYPPSFEVAPVKDSGVGLASLILAVVTVIIGWIPLLALVVMGAVAEAKQEPLAEDDPMMMLGGCSILLGLLVALIGTGLGIAGCCMRGKRKRFAVTGLIANSSFLLIASFLIIIGLMVGG